MSKRMIKPVSDNYDKQNTYRVMMNRYKKAMAQEFFFEAMMIDYAAVEDRLRSALYHSGLFLSSDSMKTSKLVRRELLPIIDEYKKKDEKTDLGVTSISSKLKILRCICEWVSTTDRVSESNYLKVLKNQYESVDIDELLSIITEIDEWRMYRNEIIHSLLNKNMCDVESQIIEKAEKGMELARRIDKQVRVIKKGNRIRKSANLKI